MSSFSGRDLLQGREETSTKLGSQDQFMSQKFKKHGKKASSRLKIAFLTLSISVILMHFFAMYLTRIIMFAGIGQEGNPLYYMMGTDYFVAFGFVLLVGYYSVEWLLRIPSSYKIIGASWLTALTAIDFFHDLLYLLGYNVWPFLHLLSL